jgi:micrococcal nuclease
MMKIFFSLAFIIFSAFAVIASPITGKVVGVSDGDTIKVLSEGKTVKIRFYGIDAPEKKNGQAFNQVATKVLKSLLSATVTVEQKGVGKYDRIIGVVYSDAGMNLNREMVKLGYAWVYKKYCRETFCDEWSILEEAARNNKVGLWKQQAIPPWEFRRKN